MIISKRELQRRIKIAKTMLGLAHLHSFGLLLYPNEEVPKCFLCGGENAPIVGGKHLHKRFCFKKGE